MGVPVPLFASAAAGSLSGHDGSSGACATVWSARAGRMFFDFNSRYISLADVLLVSRPHVVLLDYGVHERGVYLGVAEQCRCL